MKLNKEQIRSVTESLKEKLGGDFKNLKAATNFLFILLISVLIK